jgi:hypothetical protein
MEVTTQGEGGGAAVRLNDSGFAEAATDEALEVAGGNFTLEARFKTGAVPKGYASIFSKNDRANGQICDFLLYVQPGNTIHFQSVSPRGTYGWNVPGAMVKADEWAYVAVVVQPEQQKITFYVNGKMVHEIRQAFQFCAQGTPVFIGESPAYTGLGAPEKVQFVRLSKVARTAAEIADFQSCLQNAPVVLWGSGSRGLSLRDGAYLRAELPKIAGISFRTRYGNLRLDEKSTGEICVYRFRPGDLSRVEGEVKQLIEKLGESGIAERDEARLKLLEFGEAALAQLRKNSGSSDSEIRKRIEAILAKLEERGMAAKPVADVLRVGSTVLHGWLEAETLEAASRFGTFDIPVGSIESIRLGDGPAPGTPFLRLKSGERLEGELQRGSAVVLDTGFGGLTIPIREITALTADSGAETWTVRTDRLSAKGKLGQGEFQIQTPAGRLKIPLAEVSEIVRKP